MNFTNLKMNSIIIAPSHLHMQIHEEMIKERNGMLGVRIVSLSQFLSNYHNEELLSMPHALLQVKNIVNDQMTDFTTYQSLVSTPLFLKECYQFINDIRFWNISLTELPQKTVAHKELLIILQAFSTIRMQSDIYKSILASLKTQSFAHVTILDTYKSLEDKLIIDTLCQQGAHLEPMETFEPQKEFYHAVNKRSEIEACAQYIITHKLKAEDIHMTLCDISYQPIVSQIFHRYQIPLTLVQSNHSSYIPKRFLALLNFYLEPTSEHVLACFDAGLFACKGLHQVREYMQVFNHDFFAPFTHVRSIHDAGNILDTYTLDSLQALEEEASQVMDEVLPIFITLRETAINDICKTICSYVKESLSTNEDTTPYKQIVSLLEDVHSQLCTKEDFAFITTFIEDISIHESPSILQGVFVHALTQNILHKQHHFMLGATQGNYPAFSTKKGIFDEAYYAEIKRYPTMQERYQHYLDELEKLLYTAPNIYISYPLSTFEGKGMECALEIEQFMNLKPAAYPIQETYQPLVQQHHITPSSAKALFVKENVIRGSISSIERFVKCPFSYFLRYGLSLKEPMKPGFPDSYAGTLSHYILEALINTFGKDYSEHACDMIQTTLEEELSKLQSLFPSMQDALCNVKERLLISLSQTMNILQDFEQHSSLTPTKCEYEFRYDIPIEEELVLSMKGFIDRIDESSEFAAILDYKSSIKTLSEANVFAALQLQLLTYAMVLSKESGKAVLGAYYISLKNENIPFPAGHISRRKPVTHHINDTTMMENERKKTHRLNGWTMCDHIEMLDDDANHIKGISQNKDGIIKTRKLYDLPSITTHFTTMYQMITKRIVSGDIACKPLEEACTYCVYHEICRFNGYYEEKKLLIEVGDEIYQKGESEDA